MGFRRRSFAPSIPIVSIPLDYDNPSGWQAVAHEMGHHIFAMRLILTISRGCSVKSRKRWPMHCLPSWASDASSATGAVSSAWLSGIAGCKRPLPMCVASCLPVPPCALRTGWRPSRSQARRLDGKHDEQHPSLYLRPLIALQVVREVAAASSRLDYQQKLLEWAAWRGGDTKPSRRLRRSVRAEKAAAAEHPEW